MTETEITLDKRIFTVNCAFNLLGFDVKPFNDGGYHWIRRKIRRSLKAKNLETKDELKQYISKFDEIGYSNIGEIISYSIHLSQPPEFELLEKPKMRTEWKDKVIEGKEGLNKALTKFYKEADIGSYWKKYRSEYERYKAKAEEQIQRRKPVDRLEEFLGKEIEFDKVKLMPSVLFSGGYYFVKGPENLVLTNHHKRSHSDKFYSHILMHETIHPVIQPWLLNNEELIQKSSHRKKEVPEGTPAEIYYTSNGWNYYVEELIVRITSCYLTTSGKLEHSTKENLKNKGFVHTDLIDKELEKYEETDQTFQEYLPNILKELSTNNK